MSQRSGQVKLGAGVPVLALSGLVAGASVCSVAGRWRKKGHPQVSQASQSHRTWPGCHPEQRKRTATEAVRKGWVRERLFKQYRSDQRKLLSGTCSSSSRNQQKPTCPIDSPSVTKANSRIFSCCSNLLHIT